MDKLKADISATLSEFELEFEREKSDLKKQIKSMHIRIDSTLNEWKSSFSTIIDQALAKVEDSNGAASVPSNGDCSGVTTSSGSKEVESALSNGERKEVTLLSNSKGVDISSNSNKNELDDSTSKPSTSSSSAETSQDIVQIDDDDDGLDSDSSIILEEEVPVERNSFTWLLNQQQKSLGLVPSNTNNDANLTIDTSASLNGSTPAPSSRSTPSTSSIITTTISPQDVNSPQYIQTKVENYCSLFSRDRFITCPLPSCLTELASRGELELHFGKLHPDLKLYRCPIMGCGGSFPTHQKFALHLKKVHTKLTNYPCNLCKLEFKSFWPLVLHLLVEHENGKYECSFRDCSYTGTTRENVRMHCFQLHQDAKTSGSVGLAEKRKHEDSNSKAVTEANKHLCDFPNCGLTFDSGQALVSHQYTHYGAKPYRCLWKGCGMSFQLRGICYEHVGSKHFKMNGRQQSAASKEMRRRINNCIDYYPGGQAKTVQSQAQAKSQTPTNSQSQGKAPEEEEVIEILDDDDYVPPPSPIPQSRLHHAYTSKNPPKRLRSIVPKPSPIVPGLATTILSQQQPQSGTRIYQNKNLPHSAPRNAFNVTPGSDDSGIYQGYSRVSFMSCSFEDCSLRLKSRADYEQHLITVHGANPYRCPIQGCGESFNVHTDLEGHFRGTHSHLSDWLCDQCNSSFKHLVSLLKHLCFEHETGHFICIAPGCTFSGQTRSIVHNHYAIKHRVTKYLSTCDYPGCGMESKGNSLVMHQYVHMPHLRPFYCKFPNCFNTSVSRATTYSHIAVKHYSLSQKYGEHNPDQRRLVESMLGYDSSKMITDPISFSSLKFDGRIEDFLAGLKSIREIDSYIDFQASGVLGTATGVAVISSTAAALSQPKKKLGRFPNSTSKINGRGSGRNKTTADDPSAAMVDFETVVVQEFLKQKQIISQAQEEEEEIVLKMVPNKHQQIDSAEKSQKEFNSSVEPSSTSDLPAADNTSSDSIMLVDSVEPVVQLSEATAEPYRIVYLSCSQKKCTAKLRCREEYVEHLEEEHALKPYRCTLRRCKETFVDGESFFVHFTTAHPNLFEFNCTECTESFSTSAELFTHLRAYHEAGLFECVEPECGFTGTSIGKISRHIEKRHPHPGVAVLEEADEEEEEEGVEEVEPVQKEQHSTTAEWNCDYPNCDGQFSRKSELITHQYEHKIIKPYRCGVVGCSYSSALIQDVRDHLADTVEHAAEELAGKNHEDLIVILSEWIIEEPIRFTSEAS